MIAKDARNSSATQILEEATLPRAARVIAPILQPPGKNRKNDRIATATPRAPIASQINAASR